SRTGASKQPNRRPNDIPRCPSSRRASAPIAHALGWSKSALFRMSPAASRISASTTSAWSASASTATPTPYSVESKVNRASPRPRHEAVLLRGWHLAEGVALRLLVQLDQRAHAWIGDSLQSGDGRPHAVPAQPLLV